VRTESEELQFRNPALHRAPLGYRKNGPLTWVAECRVPREAPKLARLEMARWMIENGSDVHQGGDGPLMRAALADERLPMMELLLEYGADVNALWDRRYPILCAPCETLAPKALKWLLDHGADPNAATAEGYTALMAASILGNPEAVALLLKKNADPQAQTRQGQTALMLAQLSRNRIAAYDRTGGNAPYISVPEPTLLKQAQAKHDRVIQLLQSARQRTRK